ncbi:MAG: hypothetical protein DRI79_11270 [Chloroflexi bacterium]|nr:MAG: hypothetical protein DRI80_14685 [Chloroflexota bacterium]RLC85511.1 MAG: hypothetical protein DRI79_11270 [Chloroflexota bacterium]
MVILVDADPAGSHRLQWPGDNAIAYSQTDGDAVPDNNIHAAHAHCHCHPAFHAPADTYSRYAYSNT